MRNYYENMCRKDLKMQESLLLRALQIFVSYYIMFFCVKNIVPSFYGVYSIEELLGGWCVIIFMMITNFFVTGNMLGEVSGGRNMSKYMSCVLMAMFALCLVCSVHYIFVICL
jgi:hypothetical protein